MVKLILHNNKGKMIPIGKEIGSGGEGKVYELQDSPEFVAKLYHKSLEHEKIAKLNAMIKISNVQLSETAPWPIELVFDRNKSAVGFIMPKVAGYKEIHKLYGPKTRLSEFPSADWAFVIHAAANLARSFFCIHANGQVIGDVNHNNIIVATNGVVKLIDCDSFQITSNGNIFPCDVGVLTHQPPEFQSTSSFRGLVRTQNHDNFGLAVLIFQLLFMGRHPFSGQYIGPGEISLEKAIKEYRFVYGKNANQQLMRQPPGSLALSALPDELALLFEKAFSQIGNTGMRPQAKDWVESLTLLGKRLKKCSANNNHSYYNDLKVCPWCEIENRTGIILFNTTLTVISANNTFNIESVWRQIISIQPPHLLSPPISPNAINVTPSQKALDYSKARKLRKSLAIVFAIIAPIILFLSPIRGVFFFLSLVLTFFIAKGINTGGDRTIYRELSNIRVEAKRNYDLCKERWIREASNEKFTMKLQLLEEAKENYKNLEKLKRNKLKHLRDIREKRQRDIFLDRFRISDSLITAIGPGRKATLQSYGIETALDITQYAIRAVPGFGPSLTTNLILWRQSIERKFVFDSSKGIDPADTAKLNKEISEIKQALEKTLINGSAELSQIARQINNGRTVLKPIFEKSLQALAQAEADIKIISQFI